MLKFYITGVFLMLGIVLITIRGLQKKRPDDKTLRCDGVNTWVAIGFSLGWPLVLTWICVNALVGFFEFKPKGK